MAEIINLRNARKARKRADKERKAEENRARFGRKKSETLKDKLDQAREARELDGKRREPEVDGSD